ncbi:MAG: hypothetical protein JO112_09920 [Planctomycetes bacterium]|nr:hypothetical protein [Planctomycetota bacterium]
MAVILNLPPAVEQQLKERANRLGQTLEEYLQQLALREAEGLALASSRPAITYPPEFSSPAEWVKALREWAENHPRVDHFVDDSRESIYAGRGE